jgi:phosphoglycolate phosphatase
MINSPSPSNVGIIMWDIDGTLLNVNRPNSVSPHKNVLQKKGLLPHSFINEFSGFTDYEVLLALIQENGSTADQELLMGAFMDLDEESNSLDAISNFNLCPGVQTILKSLTSQGWVHGILTGNTATRLNSKLHKTAIDRNFSSEFIFGCSYGDSRKNIVERAKNYLSNSNFSTLLVIGDTPNDILTAKTASLPVIAVATGRYSKVELEFYNPDLVIKDLIIDDKKFFNFLGELIL